MEFALHNDVWMANISDTLHIDVGTLAICWCWRIHIFCYLSGCVSFVRKFFFLLSFVCCVNNNIDNASNDSMAKKHIHTLTREPHIHVQIVILGTTRTNVDDSCASPIQTVAHYLRHHYYHLALPFVVYYYHH